MKLLSTLLALSLATLLTGCGDDDDDSPGAAPVFAPSNAAFTSGTTTMQLNQTTPPVAAQTLTFTSGNNFQVNGAQAGTYTYTQQTPNTSRLVLNHANGTVTTLQMVFSGYQAGSFNGQRVPTTGAAEQLAGTFSGLTITAGTGGGNGGGQTPQDFAPSSITSSGASFLLNSGTAQNQIVLFPSGNVATDSQFSGTWAWQKTGTNAVVLTVTPTNAAPQQFTMTFNSANAGAVTGAATGTFSNFSMVATGPGDGPTGGGSGDGDPALTSQEIIGKTIHFGPGEQRFTFSSGSQWTDQGQQNVFGTYVYQKTGANTGVVTIDYAAQSSTFPGARDIYTMTFNTETSGTYTGQLLESPTDPIPDTINGNFTVQ